MKVIAAGIAVLVLFIIALVVFNHPADAHQPGTKEAIDIKTCEITPEAAGRLSLRTQKSLVRACKRVVAHATHRVNDLSVHDSIINSNAGGWCGKGDWSCHRWTIQPELFYGGDGNPAVGDHSWQFVIFYNEQYLIVGQTRSCRIVERWYHYSYGEAYLGALKAGSYRDCW